MLLTESNSEAEMSPVGMPLAFGGGQSVSALPQESDIDLPGSCGCVIHLDT